MQRNRQANHTSIQEKEADDAEKCLAIVKIQFGFPWDQQLQDFGSTAKFNIAR